MTTTKRDQDVVELLLAQHTQIKTLFGDISAAQGDRKRELFEDLVRLLAVHESAEEDVVHPIARRKIDAGDEVVDRRLREEDEAKHAGGLRSDPRHGTRLADERQPATATGGPPLRLARGRLTSAACGAVLARALMW